MWGTGGERVRLLTPHEAETSSFPRTCLIGYSPQNGIWVPRNLGPTAFFAVEKICDTVSPPPSLDILLSSPIVGESATSFSDRDYCVNQSVRKCEVSYIKLCLCAISHRYIVVEEGREEMEVTEVKNVTKKNELYLQYFIESIRIR